MQSKFSQNYFGMKRPKNISGESISKAHPSSHPLLLHLIERPNQLGNCWRSKQQQLPSVRKDRDDRKSTLIKKAQSKTD